MGSALFQPGLLFFGDIFPMGSLIMTGLLICFLDVEAACFQKEAFKRGYLWIWDKKGGC